MADQLLMIGGIVQMGPGLSTLSSQTPSPQTLTHAKPCPDLEVWLVEKGLCCRTDEHGRFVFRRVPGGQYTLEVHEPTTKGVLAQHLVTVPSLRTQSTLLHRDTVILPKDQEEQKRLKLIMRPLVFRLDPTIICGFVTLGQQQSRNMGTLQGKPYAGVEVRLVPSGISKPLGKATTDALGYFVLPRPPTGSYSVEVWEGRSKKGVTPGTIVIRAETDLMPHLLLECTS